MKKIIFAFAAIALLFACKAENNDEAKTKVPEGAVDLGIVMTRADGTTYKLFWAKSNLSNDGLCDNPEDYGDYYAWGETKTKSDYSWSTYKFGTSEYGLFSKYTGTDNKTVLDPEDDVAHVKLSGKWRMPTDAEWKALVTKCNWKWTTQNEVDGYKVTGSNGNSIFLPAAGYWYGNGPVAQGSYAYYWSSSLKDGSPDSACNAYFDGTEAGISDSKRCDGQSVRPVTE